MSDVIVIVRQPLTRAERPDSVFVLLLGDVEPATFRVELLLLQSNVFKSVKEYLVEKVQGSFLHVESPLARAHHGLQVHSLFGFFSQHLIVAVDLGLLVSSIRLAVEHGLFRKVVNFLELDLELVFNGGLLQIFLGHFSRKRFDLLVLRGCFLLLFDAAAGIGFVHGLDALRSSQPFARGQSELVCFSLRDLLDLNFSFEGLLQLLLRERGEGLLQALNVVAVLQLGRFVGCVAFVTMDALPARLHFLVR
mmetsp:Transcript_10025/g.15227  ORF Transcript_10025/g.15227 Transcript_10025/m.15227 type:complete len:250 (+) Transcript_10025:5090-5839(+)